MLSIYRIIMSWTRKLSDIGGNGGQVSAQIDPEETFRKIRRHWVTGENLSGWFLLPTPLLSLRFYYNIFKIREKVYLQLSLLNKI